MAIKYTPELNSEIQRIVRNFNRKVLRLEKANFRNIPARTSVSELKGRYENKQDLRNELNRLKRFNRKDLVKDVENKGGNKAIRWELKFIKSNLKSALEYYQNEYKRVEKRIGTYPGERMYLNTLEAKINYLNMDLDYVNQEDFRSIKATITEFAIAPTRSKNQYRGFLSELEWIMDTLGYDNNVKDRFFNKFKKLSPSQFLYLYNENDLISRIYGLYHRDYGDQPFLTESEVDAKELVDELLEQQDEMIKEAKANMD